MYQSVEQWSADGINLTLWRLGYGSNERVNELIMLTFHIHSGFPSNRHLYSLNSSIAETCFSRFGLKCNALKIGHILHIIRTFQDPQLLYSN